MDGTIYAVAAMIFNQTSQLAVVMVVFPLLMKFAGKPMNDVLQQVAMKVEVLLPSLSPPM